MSAGASYDVVIVGGGTAAYPAAIRMGREGLRVAMIERAELGGTCLHRGCIPSKAVISLARLVDRAREAGAHGVHVEGITLDVDAMRASKEATVAHLHANVQALVRGAKAETIAGEAEVIDARTVLVHGRGSREIRAERALVLATGARARTVPGLAIDGERVIDSSTLLALGRIPQRLLVVGGGVIGVELGGALRALGSEVTIVELADRLLPGVDRDLAAVVERALRRRGVEILLGAKAVDRRDGPASTTFDVATRDGSVRSLEVDQALVAIGFRPATDALALDRLDVRVDRGGHPIVDQRMRTSAAGVYAIGDLAGGPYLAHKAIHEGELAAEAILGERGAARDWRAMPAVTFSMPEVATVGLGEDEARARGIPVWIGRFPFAASGRARAERAPEGLVKAVVGDDGTVLGMGVVGDEAGTLISEASLAIEMGAHADDVGLTVHPHPTLSEGVAEAFRHALGRSVHLAGRGRRIAPQAA